MKIETERVSRISNKIINKLINDHLITIGQPLSKNDLIGKIEHVIVEELSVEIKIEEEVKKILEGYEHQIGKGEIDYRKMFLMIKNKLIKERGVII